MGVLELFWTLALCLGKRKSSIVENKGYSLTSLKMLQKTSGEEMENREHRIGRSV